MLSDWLSKYGEDAFDIGDSYILVTIPYDKDVLGVANRNINVGINVGTNVGLNATWVWTQDELWFWDGDLLSVIDRSEGVCICVVENCSSIVRAHDGTYKMVCYNEDGVFGFFERLSFEEQVSAATEILAEYEMPQEYKDFYGIA